MTEYKVIYKKVSRLSGVKGVNLAGFVVAESAAIAADIKRQDIERDGFSRCMIVRVAPHSVGCKVALP